MLSPLNTLAGGFRVSQVASREGGRGMGPPKGSVLYALVLGPSTPTLWPDGMTAAHGLGCQAHGKVKRVLMPAQLRCTASFHYTVLPPYKRSRNSHGQQDARTTVSSRRSFCMWTRKEQSESELFRVKKLKLQTDPQETKPQPLSLLWTVSLQDSRARLKAIAA